MRVVKWIYLKEASKNGSWTALETGSLTLRQETINVQAQAQGTHPLVASSSCWKVWEIVVSLQRSKKCRIACTVSKSYPQATGAYMD
jgi:hypothetical protein